MRVFFNSGEIIEGHSAPVKRAIKYRVAHDKNLRYKFSGPFEDWEEVIYFLRSGYPFEWICDMFPSRLIGGMIDGGYLK